MGRKKKEAVVEEIVSPEGITTDSIETIVKQELVPEPILTAYNVLRIPSKNGTGIDFHLLKITYQGDKIIEFDKSNSNLYSVQLGYLIRAVERDVQR